MAPVYRIRFTPQAAEQLQEIFRFIERDSPERASHLIAHLLTAIDALEQLPHRYKILEDVDTGAVQVRSMPVPPYLVRYRVDDANLAVHVLSVRHGGAASRVADGLHSVFCTPPTSTDSPRLASGFPRIGPIRSGHPHARGFRVPIQSESST